MSQHRPAKSPTTLAEVLEASAGTRPSGPTSPPFDGHGMVDGQRLREDWFPTIYRTDAV